MTARPRCWIVSSASGGAAAAGETIRRAARGGEVFETRSGEDVCRHVRGCAPAPVIVSGGDGAWREAMEAAGEDQPLGLFPAGTLGQARIELGLPARAAWRDWRAERCYLGRARGAGGSAGFFLMLGVGVEAEAVAMVRRRWKRWLGRYAYLAAILERLIRPVRREIVVHADGRSWRTSQLLVQRGRYYAGPFPVAPGRSVFSSGYTLLIWKRSGRLGWCLGMAARMFGLSGARWVETVEVDRCRIEGGRSCVTQMDGDPGPALPLEIVPAQPRCVALPEDS